MKDRYRHIKAAERIVPVSLLREAATIIMNDSNGRVKAEVERYFFIIDRIKNIIATDKDIDKESPT